MWPNSTLVSVVVAASLTACAAPSDTPATMRTPATVSVDPHSHARPDQVRVSHISLDWTVDFEARVLRGSATLTLERAPGAGDLLLDGRDLAIERVEGFARAPEPDAEAVRGIEAGTPLAFDVDRPGAPGDGAVLGDRIRIRLARDTRAVRIVYATSPEASGLLWLAPEQTDGGDAPYLFSQAQAIHARSFLPCQDSPGVRATWDAVVRVPASGPATLGAGLTAVLSARRLEPRPGDAPGTFRFALDRPVPAYLIAIAVGRLELRETGPRTGVWSEPGVVGAAADEFADLERMLDAVEALYGPYRWGRYEVLVLPPSFPFGGMENPIVTFATPTLLAGDRSLVNVIAHELAHSWSGNLVTNATWDDFWLNEGFTVYLERRIVEKIYGREAAAQDAILGRASLMEAFADDLADKPADQHLLLDLAGRDPDDGMTSVAYEKGALFLMTLEAAVGRERFDAFLRAWFDDHAFQSVTTAQFEALVRDELLGGDAARARALQLDAWIRGPGLPDNAPADDPDVFAACERAAHEFAAGERPAAELGAARWTTNEWLHFFDQVPRALPSERMAALDSAWNLTERGNAEIAAAWLELAVRSSYAPAHERLERFLSTIGRRKFLKPLYQALAETPEGLARGRAIYARSRAGYHAIAQRTLDELLGV